MKIAPKQIRLKKHHRYYGNNPNLIELFHYDLLYFIILLHHDEYAVFAE